jgi:drug/metabolite transporter (DMT)-like permease
MARASLVRLLALACIWGSSFLFIKVALEGLSPGQVVLGRLLAGATFLCVSAAVRGLSPPRSRALWRHLVVIAVINSVLPFYLFAWGEQHVDSGVAGILNAATPLMTVLASLVLLAGEQVTRSRVIGLAIGFAGVVVTVGPWETGRLGGSVTGQLACLGAAVCYGVGFTYTRRFVAQGSEPLVVLAAGQMTAAAVIVLLLAPVVASGPTQLEPRVVASVLALGVLGTGAAYLLYYALIRDEGATTAATTLYLMPVVAVALGVVVRHESLHWFQVAGAALIVLGVAVSEGRVEVAGG